MHDGAMHTKGVGEKHTTNNTPHTCTHTHTHPLAHPLVNPHHTPFPPPYSTPYQAPNWYQEMSLCSHPTTQLHVIAYC